MQRAQVYSLVRLNDGMPVAELSSARMAGGPKKPEAMRARKDRNAASKPNCQLCAVVREALKTGSHGRAQGWLFPIVDFGFRILANT